MLRLRISMQPISMMRSPSLALSPVVSVSSTTCLVICRDSFIGESIRSLVLRVAGMAPYPVPFYLVLRVQLIELLPQIDVLDRLLVSRDPALALPASHPLGNTLLHVLRVGV